MFTEDSNLGFLRRSRAFIDFALRVALRGAVLFDNLPSVVLVFEMAESLAPPAEENKQGILACAFLAVVS